MGGNHVCSLGANTRHAVILGNELASLDFWIPAKVEEAVSAAP